MCSSILTSCPCFFNGFVRPETEENPAGPSACRHAIYTVLMHANTLKKELQNDKIMTIKNFRRRLHFIYFILCHLPIFLLHFPSSSATIRLSFSFLFTILNHISHLRRYLYGLHIILQCADAVSFFLSCPGNKCTSSENPKKQWNSHGRALLFKRRRRLFPYGLS